jgi:hypothetical protein
MRRKHIALGRTTAIAAVAAGTLGAACSAAGPTDRPAADAASHPGPLASQSVDAGDD